MSTTDVPDVVAGVPKVVADVPQLKADVPDDVLSPIAQLSQDVSFMSLFESKTQEKQMGAREAVERGLQAFNAIPNVCTTITDAVKNAVKDAVETMHVRFNPEIALLSDFVQHCKMLISVNGPSRLEKEISGALKAIIAKPEFKNP